MGRNRFVHLWHILALDKSFEQLDMTLSHDIGNRIGAFFCLFLDVVSTAHPQGSCWYVIWVIGRSDKVDKADLAYKFYGSTMTRIHKCSSTWEIVVFYQITGSYCSFLHVHLTAEVANNSANPVLLSYQVSFLLPNSTLAGSASRGLFQKDKCARFKRVFGRSVVTALNSSFFPSLFWSSLVW